MTGPVQRNRPTVKWLEAALSEKGLKQCDVIAYLGARTETFNRKIRENGLRFNLLEIQELAMLLDPAIADAICLQDQIEHKTTELRRDCDQISPSLFDLFHTLIGDLLDPDLSPVPQKLELQYIKDAIFVVASLRAFLNDKHDYFIDPSSVVRHTICPCDHFVGCLMTSHLDGTEEDIRELLLENLRSVAETKTSSKWVLPRYNAIYLLGRWGTEQDRQKVSWLAKREMKKHTADAMIISAKEGVALGSKDPGLAREYLEWLTTSVTHSDAFLAVNIVHSGDSRAWKGRVPSGIDSAKHTILRLLHHVQRPTEYVTYESYYVLLSRLLADHVGVEAFLAPEVLLPLRRVLASTDPTIAAPSAARESFEKTFAPVVALGLKRLRGKSVGTPRAAPSAT